jgi:hypothetical protein
MPKLPCCTDLMNMKQEKNGNLNGTEPENHPCRGNPNPNGPANHHSVDVVISIIVYPSAYELFRCLMMLRVIHTSTF